MGTSFFRFHFKWIFLDRWILGISILSMLTFVGLISVEYLVPPYVQDFNWQATDVLADQTHLKLTFNRPMDPESVAQSLRIQPFLPGQFHWMGRRLVYQLDQPVTYGQTYQLSLSKAKDHYGQEMQTAFQGTFQTPDPKILFVGLNGEQQGRLVLKNQLTQVETILTPPNLRITDFQPTRNHQTLYLFGTYGSLQDQDLYELSLEGGSLNLLLDHSIYQNLKFQVSPDGSLLIVERINPQQPIQTELWIRPLTTSTFTQLQLGSDLTGDFLITPDNSSLVIARGQGIAVVPLNLNQSEIFLPEFGQILALSSDGTTGALIKFNSDYTRSLWIVNNAGSRQEILKTTGSILSGAFAPTGSTFYSLTTQVSEIDYTESPALVAIQWETQQQIELVSADFPTELDFSLAPDGRSLIYTLLTPYQDIPDPKAPISPSGQAIANSQVRWMNLQTDSIQDLEIATTVVKWIP